MTTTEYAQAIISDRLREAAELRRGVAPDTHPARGGALRQTLDRLARHARTHRAR